MGEISVTGAAVVVIGLRNADQRCVFRGMALEESTGPGVPPPTHEAWRGW